MSTRKPWCALWRPLESPRHGDYFCKKVKASTTATESSPQSPREPRRATQPARSRRQPANDLYGPYHEDTTVISKPMENALGHHTALGRPDHQCQSVRQLPQHLAARLRQCWQPVEGELRAEHPSRVDQLGHLDAQGVRPSSSPRRTDAGPVRAALADAQRGHIRLTRSPHTGRWGLERRCRDARQVTGMVGDDCPWRLGGVVRFLGMWLSHKAHHDKVSMAIQRRCASVSTSV